MLQTDISGVHLALDDKLQKYTQRKIGGLEKYLSRPLRKSARAKVTLKERSTKELNKALCEVVLHLPQETIVVSEATVNMYAAIDIVEEKLKHSLRKYKELHSQPRAYRRVVKRLKRAADNPEV